MITDIPQTKADTIHAKNTSGKWLFRNYWKGKDFSRKRKKRISSDNSAYLSKDDQAYIVDRFKKIKYLKLCI